ncbi:MAG TPA: asparagine synthase (glutamine-hydrolyzing) [Candidatus Binatia bacterium]
MCGICGQLASESRPSADEALLRRLNATLRHRGPDSDGYYVNTVAGLAISRLAIIDVVGGNQPIANEDGSIVVVFNGEIYNFRELRSELQNLGHRFGTQSDTEVIVHGYEQWGDQALDHFNGMFAIALWDERRERLLLARDRMGKKPLYWHWSKHGLLFGSEAKALLAAPWVERRINPLALHHYLTLQYVPDPLTIFEGMSRLPAAHKLVVERGGEPQVSRWWQLEFEPKWEIDDREAIEKARGLLSAAVKRRLISEVPLGAFLSGGIDSSTIVALMAQGSSKAVKTFSIGFEEERYSEAMYARQVANRFHTDHHEFVFRASDLARLIDESVAAFDEPLADPAALPLLELSRQARQSVTVALCGDGGDETLAGYRRYAIDGLLRPYSALPGWVTQRAVPAVMRHVPEPSWMPEDRNPITGLKRLGQFSATTRKASLVRWGSYFTHENKLSLYSDCWREAFAQIDSADWIANAYDEAHATSQLDRTLYADHVTYLSGDLLAKTDRMTMAHSLEARSPFLDVDWVEWTARLPERFKIRRLAGKWLLKAAFGEMLPPAVCARGKQGFGVPIGHWLKNELRDWVRERLLDNSSLAQWFHPAAVQDLLDEHDSGRANHGKKLWALLIFAVWSKKFLRNNV